MKKHAKNDSLVGNTLLGSRDFVTVIEFKLRILMDDRQTCQHRSWSVSCCTVAVFQAATCFLLHHSPFRVEHLTFYVKVEVTSTYRQGQGIVLFAD